MRKASVFVLSLFFLQAYGQESTLLADWEGLLSYQKGQINALAEAMPDKVMEWGPSEEVRNSAGVLLHAASANYFLGMMLGAQIPDGVNPQTLEAEVSGRENVMKTLNASFDFVMEAAKGLDASALDQKVPFPDGNEYSKRSVMMIILSHASEHKGQLIAYGRTNGIVPPWSQSQEDSDSGDK